MNPKILTIIVTFNALAWIERCVGSVLSSSVSSDVLVVDNGSTDATISYIREHFPSVRLIESGSNLGFGAANNIGLQIACEENYDFVYLLNQDAWLFPETLSQLISASTEAFPLLSPLQCAADGQLDVNFRRKCASFLSAANIFENAPSRQLDFRLSSDIDALQNAVSAKQIVEVPFVMAAHWLLRVSAIRVVGGFSPAFQQYGEDDNYIHRLHYHGLHCGIVPCAKAIHDRSTRPSPKERTMRLKSLSSIVRLSNPCCPFAVSAVVEPFRLVATAAKNLSLYPLRYIPQLLRQYSKLRTLRTASKEKAAFL